MTFEPRNGWFDFTSTGVCVLGEQEVGIKLDISAYFSWGGLKSPYPELVSQSLESGHLPGVLPVSPENRHGQRICEPFELWVP
jgi:hypothetical protein